MDSPDHKKLAIIDGKSVFYRGYYAMPGLTTKDGTATGGVFGFATMALEVIKRLKPDYVCVAWDKPKTNIRRRLELYPEYKAGRKPPPSDFYEQIPLLHELLEAFGWPLYEFDDYEADDIMGTLAVQAAARGIDTLLITSDMDMLQLVNDNVKVYAMKKGLSNIELYSPDSFTAKYGIRVDQFLDLKALMGDSSDNIPGVPGIGEKGALELLKQFETLDNVYENLALTKASLQKKLEAGRELAYLSKELAAIWTDAPMTLDLAAVDGSRCSPLAVRDVLERLEFRSLVRQLPEIMQDASLPPSTIAAQALAVGKNIVVRTDVELDQINLGGVAEVVLFSRAAGKHGRQPQLFVFSPSADLTYTIDLNTVGQPAFEAKFGRLLSDPSISKIGYDVKSTIKLLIELGVECAGVGHDVFIGAFLINSIRREQTLTALLEADLGYGGASLENIPTDELAGRSAEIIAAIRGLHAHQTTELAAIPKVAHLAATIEWPVIAVLARMEYEGIHLDLDYLSAMNGRVSDTVSDLEQQIYGYADTEFNIGSPAQLADILFVNLKLPTLGIKKGKSAYSTDAKQLEKLRLTHPIIDIISQWREVTKLKNTYIDALPRLTDADSRLHTTFNLTVAQTGRLSSTDPNLQNIPVRTDLGREIRTAFVAAPGKVLISADYSQFELRLAAYLADDQELMTMFNNGADVHTATAAQVYGRQPDEITKQMRRDAKIINFGVLYGMSPHGLSVATGMTMAAAKVFIDKYFELRKPLLDYMNNLKVQAREQGYVETLFGRRRPTPDIKSSNFIVRQAAERAALNMPIQGTEADLMKMAMIAVDRHLAGMQSKQLLQIHDSILIEAPEAEAEAVAAMLKTTMENIYKLPVRLDVDVTIGQNWGEL